MRKACLVVAALALAVSLPVSAQADPVHRRHARIYARRAVPPPPVQMRSAGASLAAPEDAQVGSAIDAASSGFARADAASRAVTTNAFGPILRLLYPPGQSGDL